MLLFTGKGGVGKTTVAAATAVRAAAAGARVLVTSTDPAHSLADALDAPLGDDPTSVPLPGPPSVGGRLLAQQIDAQHRLERHWSEVRDYLAALLVWGGVEDVAAEELVLFPGLDELFALIDLRQQTLGGDHDLIVVDCAPTAETLKLLALPDALRWYAERVLGPGRRLARAVRPLTRPRGAAGGTMPVPDDEVFDAVGRVHAELAEVHALLSDTTRATVRLVVNPERLVLAEAERTATSLSLFGYGVDAVVVNRVLPDEVVDPYLARWKEVQAQHLVWARTAFAPTPVLHAPLLDDELVDVHGLARFAELLYDGIDAAAVLHDVQPVQVVDDVEGPRLYVALPFAAADDLELHRRGAELHLKVGGVKRNVPLPAALQRREVAGARLDDGWLEVRFVATPVAVGGS